MGNEESKPASVEEARAQEGTSDLLDSVSGWVKDVADSASKKYDEFSNDLSTTFSSDDAPQDEEGRKAAAAAAVAEHNSRRMSAAVQDERVSFLLEILRRQKYAANTLFTLLDDNGDGVLTKEELAQGLLRLGTADLELTEEDIEKVVDALDMNKDGFINYQELFAFLDSSETFLSSARTNANVTLFSERQVLASDMQYASIGNENAITAVEGVANFRRVDGYPVYICSSTTSTSTADVLLNIGAGARRVLWINLREEPVLYLEGSPIVVRDAEHVESNVEHLFGILGGAPTEVESRLRGTLLERFNGSPADVYLNAETSRPFDLTPESLVTADVIFNQIASENSLSVDYHRVPFQMDSPPEESEFDRFIEIAKQMDTSGKDETVLVLQCQTGGDRSTFAAICACILYEAIRNDRYEDSVMEEIYKSGNDAPDLLRGEYHSVRSLMSYLGDGEKSKAQVDRLIDASESAVNIRREIFESVMRAEGEVETERPRSFWITRGIKLLQRYWYLIVFAAYCNAMVESGFSQSFRDWVQQFPGLKKLIVSLELR